MWAILLFKVVPRRGVEVLSGVLERKRAVMGLMEKTHVKLHLGMSYSAVGHEFSAMSQQCMLNKMHLNRNTHKTKQGYLLIGC